MTAASSPFLHPAAGEEAGAAEGLAELLAGWAVRSPDALAFDDEVGRASWSRRPPLACTTRVADAMVSRLAAALRALRLAPGSSVAICLPGGSEACLSILAVERADLLPCLVPLAWSESEVASALRSVEARAAITQSIVADLRPAESLRGIARDYLGLRCVAAFGPTVPDGVMNLDRVLVEAPAPGAEPDRTQENATSRGLVTFESRNGKRLPMHQSAAALAAAQLAVDDARPVGSGERLLTLLAPDDLASLATGLAAALAARATLETHGLFSGAALSQALQRTPAIHVVAPASFESALAAGLHGPSKSITLVHGVPARLRRVGQLPGYVVDVLGIGEGALLASSRDPAGRCCLTILRQGCPEAQGRECRLQVARDECDALVFRSGAATARPFRRDGSPDGIGGAGWRPAGARVETLGDFVVAVTFD